MIAQRRARMEKLVGQSTCRKRRTAYLAGLVLAVMVTTWGTSLGMAQASAPPWEGRLTARYVNWWLRAACWPCLPGLDCW